jgi:hypothetical protein
LPAADFEFVVLADTHYMIDPGDGPVEFSSRRLQTERAASAWEQVASLECPHVFHLGDLVQEFPGTGDFSRAMTSAIEQFSQLGLSPHFVAGNHDVGDKPDPTMPTRPVTAESLDDFHRILGPSWYSLDLGPLHVVVLNSQIMNTDLPEADAQRRWAEQDLADHSGRRLVVMLHLPPYLDVPGEPGLGHYDNIAEPDRSWLTGLLSTHEIELLLAAHVHFRFFDRIGPTRFLVLGSTSFTRPGFCHLFNSAPPPDHGRDDAPKLGFLLARVRDEGIDLHWLRTGGRTLDDRSPDSRWHTLVTRTPAMLPRSPLGLTLAHPLSTRTEIPRAWPSAIRQRVRNDYPTLACLELGARAVRVPAGDLDDPFLAGRLEILRNERVDIIATALWDETLAVGELVERHEATADSWEWQLPGMDLPAAPQLDVLRQLQDAGVSQSLSAVVPGEPVPGKQHPRTRTGFRIEDLEELDRMLAEAGVGLDRVACRLPSGWLSVDVLSGIRRVDGLEAIRGVDWQLELDDQDDLESAKWAVMSLMATAGVDNSRLFVGPLVDMDRTMDVCNGLLDSLCNPRPVFHALGCLNTVLSAEQVTRLEWSESESVIVGESDTMMLVVPRTPSDGDGLPVGIEAWTQKTGRFRLYDLLEGLVTESGREDLVGCLGSGWSRPVLLVG